MKVLFSNWRSLRLLPVAVVALGLSVAMRSLGFVFAKQSAVKTGGEPVSAILFDPWYWALIGVLLFQALFWLIALKRLNLSSAYAAMSLVYGLNLFWAWALFGESVNGLHLLGCGIIIFGVAISSGFFDAKERT